jgi:plasmid stabilization system protein ParE
MRFKVVTLSRAEADVRSVVCWIANRSPQGASSWLDAYEQLLDFLAEQADSCAMAQENEDCDIRLKQCLFSTKHGRTYRAVFTIIGEEVRILRVRGPGQPPLIDDELL